MSSAPTLLQDPRIAAALEKPTEVLPIAVAVGFGLLAWAFWQMRPRLVLGARSVASEVLVTVISYFLD